ncbi:MAG TPA: protein-glutamate O-methyltransferase CheR, partial [Turneriella sp.]|nr:protein-glutamate O-methyltransferase CheR [Turneriella sp.]
MSDKAFPGIAAAIKRLTGLHIEPEKYYLFEHRFPEVMKEHGISDFDQLLSAIEKGTDNKLLGRVIEKITTHETRFFRDESIFDALAEQILPEWKDRNALPGNELQYPPLKLWSAACSTGQESYSIAIILAEFHPQLVKKAQIIATDISQESVERAAAGRYTNFELSRGLPEKFKRKYFSDVEGGAMINRTLLPSIDFRTHNLITQPAPDKFDIIFCRNVAYYFAQDTRKQLFEKMQASLKSDGVLILGSAE